MTRVTGLFLKRCRFLRGLKSTGNAQGSITKFRDLEDFWAFPLFLRPIEMPHVTWLSVQKTACMSLPALQKIFQSWMSNGTSKSVCQKSMSLLAKNSLEGLDGTGSLRPAQGVRF